jgi:hypothetical protein
MKYGLWTDSERLYPVATRYRPGREKIKTLVIWLAWAVMWLAVWYKMGAIFCAEFDQITK